MKMRPQLNGPIGILHELFYRIRFIPQTFQYYCFYSSYLFSSFSFLSDIGYGNYILTSPAAERKGRSKTDNATTAANDDIDGKKIYKNTKKDSKPRDKGSHSRLINLSAQRQQQLKSSGQENVLDNLSSHLKLRHHPTKHNSMVTKSIGWDADKINATELMSDINTLTNPYNQKRRIDL